mgnify:CR=1 FL=1
MRRGTGEKHQFAAENRLVVLTALDRVAADVDDVIRASIASVSDWDYVSSSLARHGTLLTFGRHVERLGLLHALPDRCREHLGRTGMVMRYRNARFFEEMKRISSAFHEQGLPLVFIKGALLVIAGYYGPEDRLMEDLDVLVPAGQAAKAVQLLMGIGYEEPGRAGGAARFRHRGEMLFINSRDRELIVELSVKLNKNHELRHCYPFADGELQQKLSPATVGGAPFFLIEKEFHFAYCLFHHVALNYLYRLNWLNDLAGMIADPEMDPDRIGRYVDAYGLRRSWGLLNGILQRHFRISPKEPLVRLPARLEVIFLDDACGFADLGTIESNNVAIRLSLIGNWWDRVLVGLKKIVLPPDWLRAYYGLHDTTPAATVYMLHLINSLKRLLKIRERHP